LRVDRRFALEIGSAQVQAALSRLDTAREGFWIMRGRMLWLGLSSLLLATPLFAQDRLQLIEQGKKLFVDQGCYGCHTVGKMGTLIAPDLSEIGSKYPPSYLLEWLRDPATQKPKAHMPKIELTEEEIRALVAYLASLR
jgi:mono/diheme cytochrome c family protein